MKWKHIFRNRIKNFIKIQKFEIPPSLNYAFKKFSKTIFVKFFLPILSSFAEAICRLIDRPTQVRKIFLRTAQRILWNALMCHLNGIKRSMNTKAKEQKIDQTTRSKKKKNEWNKIRQKQIRLNIRKIAVVLGFKKRKKKKNYLVRFKWLCKVSRDHFKQKSKQIK